MSYCRFSHSVRLLVLLHATALFLTVPVTVRAQLIPRNAAVDHTAEDRARLTEGVREIAAPGAPGGVTAFGPEAFAVVGGKDGKALIPVVAATRYGTGRVVAFGHGGYLEAWDLQDTGRLLLNAVRWAAAADDGKGKKSVRVVLYKQEKLAAWLKEQGVQTETLSGDGWTRRISRAEVLVCDAHDLRSGREGGIADITRFLTSGGGLITAATGWGWESLSKGKSIVTDFPGNELLAPSGLVFNNTTPGTTMKDGYTVGADLSMADAQHALASLTGKKGPAAASEQVSASLGLAIRTIPPADTLFRSKLDTLKSTGGTKPAHPSPKRPLAAGDAVARMLFTMEVESLNSLAPEKTTAHPAADDFPGKVPGNAPRLAKTFRIDPAIPGWHSLGLYAAPGEGITLTSPRAATGQDFQLRIGSHSDRLWHKEKWPRSPEVCRSVPITAASTTLASAWGGLVYIQIPDKAGKDSPLEFTLGGAVAAPLFELGKTTAAEWKTLRQAPGPWAELASPRIILTVPSDSIRRLSDPAEVMQFWDQAVAAEDWLAGTEEDRRRPERIVADVEISAGYMHSGYPIMTYLDVVPMVSDIAALRRGSWGHFHELGHNHQESDWTPDGTGEVTCNIFTLYVFDKVCGIPVEKAREGFSREAIRKTVREHLAAGGTLEHWKADPFRALVIYVQLQQAFGWEAFRTVFTSYRSLKSDERPKTDAEKHSRFMVRFSRTAGKNLGPFFKAWGLPVSAEAMEEVAELPAWMPEDWPR